MRIDRPLIVALATITAACATGSESATVTTRDSAGVTIIEYPAGAAGTGPQWTTGPATAVFSGLGGAEETFTQVVSARRLGDGRVVVVDFANQRTQPALFAPDGAFERLLGRPGSGPGEFQIAVVQSVLPGDTIVFWDMSALRATRMLPTGEVVGNEGPGSLGVLNLGQPTGRVADGRILSAPFPSEREAPGADKFFRRPSPVILIDLPHDRVDTLATDVPGMEMYIGTYNFGGNSESGPVDAPYGNRTHMVPAGDRILVTTNETADVRSYALPWTLRRITRFPGARRPVDAAAREGYIAFNIAALDRRSFRIPQQKEWQAQYYRESQFPDSMAYYTSALLATDSTLWLRETKSFADSVPTFRLIAPDGHLRATVTLPPNSRLYWAGPGDVLVVLRDEDDVERVELRPIIKP